MTGMNMWLDDQTLQNLKSIARKLTLPGKPSLSAEEVRAVTKLKQKKSLPLCMLKRFLANGTPLTFNSLMDVK